MRAGTRKTIGATAALIAICIVLVVGALTAFAASSPKVSGVDNYGTQSPINVLSVQGSAGDTIFVEVEHNGKVIASRVEYKLEGDKTMGIVDLSIDNYQAGDSYTVRAYADRANRELLYEGTIQPVMANLDNSSNVMMATRTVAAGEGRSFTPEASLYIDGVNYKIVRDTSGTAAYTDANGVRTYSYESYSPESSISGSITYVNDEGKTVYTQSVAGISAGSSQVVSVPPVVKDSDGVWYRTVYFGKSVVMENPGQHDFVIHVKKIEATGNLVNPNSYIATINLVSDDGSILASDSVTVTGNFTYTAPAKIYQEHNGQNTTYSLTNNAEQTLYLSADSDGAVDGAKTYTITYTKQNADAGVVYGTFNLINGTKRENDPGRILGTEDFVVDAESPLATPSLQNMMIDDENYIIAGGADYYTYDFASGRMPIVNVYYVPENYVAPDAYDVTVQYVNLANNEVITTKTYTSSPDQTKDLEIATDATISVNGTDYVRLDGQDAPIYHNYYSNYRTYTVYYRDVNDDLTANVVITRIRTVFADGTVAPGAITDESVGATNAATAGTATAALNAGALYNAINSGNGTGVITNGEGIDTNSERIEEDANPLASGLEGSQSKQQQLVGIAVPLAIGTVVGVAAIVAAVIILRRRNRKAEEN